MKTTLIAWYDHRGRYGWHDEPTDLLDAAQVLFFSIGFVVAEDEHSVVISATVEEDKETYDNSTVILKSAIHKRADIDLVADDEEDDGGGEYLVAAEETTVAGLFDPPDEYTLGAQNVGRTPPDKESWAGWSPTESTASHPAGPLGGG